MTRLPHFHSERYEQLFGLFTSLFVTFVLLTNTVGVKLFTVAGLTLPVSILWYPLTFLLTDIVSEVYGKRRARFSSDQGSSTRESAGQYVMISTAVKRLKKNGSVARYSSITGRSKR